MVPGTPFCSVGSGGHDSQPLRVQLPSPGGVVQVRGEAAASETSVRPGEHLAQRGPSAGVASLATTRNLTSLPPPMQPVLTLRPSASLVPRSRGLQPGGHFPPPGLGHPSFRDCDSGPGLPFPKLHLFPRLVNTCLAEELPHIHAFEQKTLTPEQWARERQK